MALGTPLLLGLSLTYGWVTAAVGVIWRHLYSQQRALGVAWHWKLPAPLRLKTVFFFPILSFLQAIDGTRTNNLKIVRLRQRIKEISTEEKKFFFLHLNPQLLRHQGQLEGRRTR